MNRYTPIFETEWSCRRKLDSADWEFFVTLVKLVANAKPRNWRIKFW